MATFGDLVEEVLLNLEGFSGDQEIFGTLGANILATDTTFTVAGPIFADGSGFSSGLVEIGEEMVYVQTFTRATGVATGVLRGWRGTTAAAATAGTLLRNNPKFPRFAVKRAINDTVKGLAPKLYAIKKYSFVYKGGKVRYDMPVDAKDVLQVSTSVPGPSLTWRNNKRYSFDITGSNTVTTNPALDVWDGITSRTVNVIYLGDPQPMVNLTDDFVTTTGLYDWAREIISFGASWRLSSFIDSSKININTSEQIASNQPIGSATNLSKYFLGMYQSRLNEGQLRAQNLYPVSKHYIQ